jgi:NAD(P)H-dependent flavin oxidoreductase YrpB (nitropropane dioxygenase family)
MGGVGTSELAAAVVLAGGLGMVPSGVTPVPGAAGVNFIVPFVASLEDVERQLNGSRVAEFFYGDPRPDLVDAAHRAGAIVGWHLGSVEEAMAAEASGCDFVVAQGIEAGGHVRGTLPLDQVLVATRAAVAIPVIASGGIATSQRVAQLMSLGADGVRVGTRFVTCPESGAHPDYVARLLDATGTDTVVTEWFNEGWPKAPHRVLRSALVAAQRSGWRETVPPYKGVDRPPTDMAMYAGMGVGYVVHSEPAADVVADLVKDLA